MILGARLLVLIIIIDVFLFFGMQAVSAPTDGYGHYAEQLVQLNGTQNPSADGLVNYTGGGTMVQASTMGWLSFDIGSILGFVGMIFSIATAPITFMYKLGAPIFVQVLVGSIYMVLGLAAIAQLLTGRFS